MVLFILGEKVLDQLEVLCLVMLFSKQTQRNVDLKFRILFLIRNKENFIHKSDHPSSSTNPYRGDPNVNSVFSHHYSVDTNGLCSLMGTEVC